MLRGGPLYTDLVAPTRLACATGHFAWSGPPWPVCGPTPDEWGGQCMLRHWVRLCMPGTEPPPPMLRGGPLYTDLVVTHARKQRVLDTV